jgi:hypothetical protein
VRRGKAEIYRRHIKKILALIAKKIQQSFLPAPQRSRASHIEKKNIKYCKIILAFF